MNKKIASCLVFAVLVIMFAFWIGVKTAQATYVGSGEAISLVSLEGRVYILKSYGIHAILMPVTLESALINKKRCYKLKY